MRILKISALLVLMTAFVATAAFAGPSCSASKTVKTAASSDNACLSTVFAGAGNHCSTSKAKLAQMVSIETTRMPSGVLIVEYRGKTPDAVSYLQTSSAGSIESFCCPIARKVASNKDAKVEIAKTDYGAMIIVSSEKAATVNELEISLLALAK